MTFLIDAQLPPALADWLRQSGYQARHVEEAGLRKADDRDIWRHAIETNEVIVTKDEDFAAHAARSANAPIIVWLRLGNASNRSLLTWLQPRWPGVLELLGQGQRLIEVT